MQKTNKKTVRFFCLSCHEKEEIPTQIVREMDLMDGGDSIIPPRFSCEQCGGEMYPEYYKGVHGQEYRIKDYL
ncbi:hypothetical protein C0674_15075 [Sporolactobacillus terrae]|uniref:Uncharacterized protein n=1 Tax=Sporolactobacillus terrae TaxID=269673 RepID=A0ABX5QAW9_9BACL|nr:hypothetical protein C0674_03290 [Sporolactobacillus terrae]QAA22208.1 hypothetical protein C0674_06040 [Sporolactobacillus terrae]QAA22783.1 hypothetical protein C0674_09170 [Sporolactobacillus terrae]QAA23243.1 hypothetical protein C0674_11870 [Sporolactobacillus terrae]QAA23472.1 hypothetical protein C0674_13170 [Sporolactobacillus terrae]